MRWNPSWRKVLCPPGEELTADWAEANVLVDSRGSKPGPWRRAAVSALCRPGGPVEALDDNQTEIVVLCKGAQTGGTYTAYCWLAKEMDIDPGSALVVMSTVDIARKKSGGAWRPMWEDSQTLRHKIPQTDRRRKWTNLKQVINGSTVFWIGANSAATLASVDIRRLVLDEEDKYPQSFGKGATRHGQSDAASEAGAKELAMQRIKTFQRINAAKVFELSTPTDDRGPIWTAYNEGDRRKLYVPCWKCKTMHVMEWKSFVIDMDLAKTDPAAAVRGCRYKCPHCGALHDDDARFEAVDRGEWRPTAITKDPKCKSFQAPSWISKFVLHDYLARKWIRAQGSRSALQDFLNGEAAEPFMHYEDMISDKMIITLEGAYSEGDNWTDCEPYKATIGDKKSTTLCGCDVQKGYLVAVFRRFTEDGDSGLVWAGDVSSLEALEKMAAKFGADYVFLDSRYRTNEINDWCKTHVGYIPCQGVSRKAATLFSIVAIDPEQGKRGQGKGDMIAGMTFDPDQLKDILSRLIHRERDARQWLVPKGYASNASYCSQVTAERCINGHWQAWPPGKPNHYWDAECLVLLGAIKLKWWKDIFGTEEPPA